MLSSKSVKQSVVVILSVYLFPLPHVNFSQYKVEGLQRYGFGKGVELDAKIHELIQSL